MHVSMPHCELVEQVCPPAGITWQLPERQYSPLWHSEFAAQAPNYPEVYTPTIIVASEADYVASTKRHARKLATLLPAAELVTAPGAGHMPHRLRTDLVLTAIRRVNAMASAEGDG